MPHSPIYKNTVLCVHCPNNGFITERRHLSACPNISYPKNMARTSIKFSVADSIESLEANLISFLKSVRLRPGFIRHSNLI
jgi:hypothetical protein